jgi:hypothetical protein
MRDAQKSAKKLTYQDAKCNLLYVATNLGFTIRQGSWDRTLSMSDPNPQPLLKSTAATPSSTALTTRAKLQQTFTR